jgi:hypothetical protein
MGFFRIISIICSLVMLGLGVYGLAMFGDPYWIGALVVGGIWLFADIVRIKRDNM